MNPLNAGMISLAPWVCGVDRPSNANTYNPSPNPDGSVRLNLLDSPQYPHFHIHLSTRHKHHAHIRYGDIMHPHTSLQWAINKVDGTVQVAAVRTTLRFEVARHLLPNFTVPSPKEVSQKFKRERGEYRRRRGNARDFFVLINRLFHFKNDHISVNSQIFFQRNAYSFYSHPPNICSASTTPFQPPSPRSFSPPSYNTPCGRLAKSFASVVPI